MSFASNVICYLQLLHICPFTLSSAKSRVEPPKNVSLADIKVLAEALSKVLEDDKAEDLAFIELQGKSSLADFMIIASGRSGRHVAEGRRAAAGSAGDGDAARRDLRSRRRHSAATCPLRSR